MSLCSRCFGLYLFLIIGFFLSLTLKINTYLTKNLLLVLTIILIMPLVLDSVTQLFRLRESNNILRFVTGSSAGLICGIALHYLLF